VTSCKSSDSNKKTTGYKNPPPSSQTPTLNSSSSHTWQYINDGWKATSTAPKCSTPLIKQSPVDTTQVEAILYPGQTRGQYKAHGGFRWNASHGNSVDVKLALDGELIDASRYIESGEVQYLLDFLSPCGI